MIEEDKTDEFETLLNKIISEGKHNINDITKKLFSFHTVHLLPYACTYNRLNIIKILQRNGANFKILDSDITRSQPQYMRDYFTDFTFVDSNNTSPLLAAIVNRNKELVQYLVENNVNILVKTTTNGPLHNALIKSVDIFDYLFEIYKEKCKPEVFKNLLSECIIAACSKLDETRLQKLFDNGATIRPIRPYLPNSSNLLFLLNKKHTEGEIRWAEDIIKKLKYSQTQPYSEYAIFHEDEITYAEQVLNEKDNSEAQISAILKILINNGLDINYTVNGHPMLDKALTRTLNDNLTSNNDGTYVLTLNDDGTYVNNFIAKILIDNGAKLSQSFLQRNLLNSYPELKEYYEKAQRTSQINPATMHSPESRFTMSALGLPPRQVAGKRTRRRGRSRKSRR
jgi:ankyrin repeat protein